MEDQHHPPPAPPKRQPVFNVPGAVLGMIAVFVALHIGLHELASPRAELSMLFLMAFIPVRFSAALADFGSDWTALWTPVSYTFLHADWTHLIVNSVWLLAFGSVVARRFGWRMFLLFCAAGSVGGAAFHYVSNLSSIAPMIGASAAVSACMGAAVRFAFPNHGSFSPNAFRQPPTSLSQALRNPSILGFVGVWFVINLAFGFGGELVAGAGQSIAWQAHLGGFFVGLLGFGWFDRNSRLSQRHP